MQKDGIRDVDDDSVDRPNVNECKLRPGLSNYGIVLGNKTNKTSAENKPVQHTTGNKRARTDN